MPKIFDKYGSHIIIYDESVPIMIILLIISTERALP